jgi:hypothetical protein
MGNPYVYVNGTVACAEWYEHEEYCYDACDYCSYAPSPNTAIECTESSFPEANDGSVICLCGY